MAEAIATDHKYSVCTICDIGCQLRTEVEDGQVKRVIAHDNPMLAANICYKGVAAPEIHNHAERLTVPLKRVGERGEDKWEEISYEQAMDEIAERLQKVVDNYGPEAVAVSSPLNNCNEVSIVSLVFLRPIFHTSSSRMTTFSGNSMVAVA